MKKVYLSKTSYCKCIQCPKILWLKKYKPEKAVQKARPSLFENGIKTGILAQDLLGKEHEDIKYNRNHRMMTEKTRKCMDNRPNIITEASFDYENNFCRVDILKNDEDGVEIYEVKSSTKITDIYLDDVSFQYYILSGLGLNVKKAYIVYVNNRYIRQNELNLDEWLIKEDITDIVLEKQEDVRRNVETINGFMSEHDGDSEPDIPVGKHCFNPYHCDFMEYCTMNLENDNSVFEEDEYNDSIGDDGVIIDKNAIRELMDSLKYPLYFIDYETYTTPIPEIEGTYPYQNLPFQYSLHIKEDEDAALIHKEFLAEHDDDNFVRHFAESMTDNLSEDGSVIVYNKTFEESLVNDKLAKMFPDLREKICRINENMVDFMEPFRKKQYYNGRMHDSCSIKNVLSALYPDEPGLDYGNLSGVHDGAEASEAFLGLKKRTPEEREKIRCELLKYCELDTYAMVKIWEKFNEV